VPLVVDRLALGDERSVHFAGDLVLLDAPAVSVVGSRDASARGLARASRLARELSTAGVTVVSGLAKGIDTAAHTAAIEAGGRTVAVIGTPLDRCYPSENAQLQMEIYEKHLLISQFSWGSRTYPSDFPKRNRLMSALTDATVIVEASDTSGALHQAVEALKLGRWLFIAKSLVESSSVVWPRRFISNERCVVLDSTSDVVNRIKS